MTSQAVGLVAKKTETHKLVTECEPLRLFTHHLTGLSRNNATGTELTTMAAPTQAKRHLSTPLSRSQRSATRAVSVLLLGMLGILTFGGFLVSKIVRPTTMDSKVVDEPMMDYKDASLQSRKSLEISKEDKATLLMEDKNRNSNKNDNRINGTLLLTTEYGTIRIGLRPDLSPESVEYIRELVKSGTCPNCNLYRAEKPGILQGVMAFAPEASSARQVTKGRCPPEYENVKPVECPKHDPNCGCHGPTMTRGMVGWAGGGTGPDFFINSYPEPATFWGQHHTVFGEIKDDASFAIIDKIYEFPVTKKEMTYLDTKLEFTLALE